MTEAPSTPRVVSFAAWRDDAPEPGTRGVRRYVTLAELLVRLGSFGLGLRWRARFSEDQPHPAFDELVAASAGNGMPTLALLATRAPYLQAVDADFEGYAGTELVVTLREFDSSSWDVRTDDPWVLREIQRHYPDAGPLTADEWDATG